MKLETLNKANEIDRQLRKWKDIDLRLSVGKGSCSMYLDAYETKTMPHKYILLIDDKATIAAYAKFVKDSIKRCKAELEKL